MTAPNPCLNYVRLSLFVTQPLHSVQISLCHPTLAFLSSSLCHPTLAVCPPLSVTQPLPSVRLSLSPNPCLLSSSICPPTLAFCPLLSVTQPLHSVRLSLSPNPCILSDFLSWQSLPALRSQSSFSEPFLDRQLGRWSVKNGGNGILSRYSHGRTVERAVIT